MEREMLASQGSPELKERLPRGAIKALAKKYGYSLVWISRVVTGRNNGDPRILEDALQMAVLEDDKRAQLRRIVSSETPEILQP